jgi:acyl-coenzyme A synthetase/AMP-(fatty) acid ligase
MPMIPEAVFSMLASARVGAIHSVVFGGFSVFIKISVFSRPKN